MDINERELYPENSQPLKRLLRDMAMLDIVHVGKFFFCVCVMRERVSNQIQQNTHTHNHLILLYFFCFFCILRLSTLDWADFFPLVL